MIKIVGALLIALVLNASENTSNALTLDEAIEILKSENLEIKTASLDVDSAKAEVQTASGNHWGKLDFIQDYANSNDAGNVFGFKLTSREAEFSDFGFSEFFDSMNSGAMNTPAGQQVLLKTQPHDLNYPDARNFFQSKLKYEVPLFTGFQISSYVDIMESMTKMKKLEKSQVINEKIYQIRKSFYDMALLRNSTKNLNTILTNIETLEDMTKEMIDVGYAKKVDLLEVQAKKGNVQRLILQMESNQKLLYHYISFLLNQKVQNISTPASGVSMPMCSNEDVLSNNIDIQKASTGLEVRKSMVDVSKSSFYPMVGAFAEASTADDTFFGDADDHKAYTVGARLTWNIFNGGIDDANVEKSRIEQIKTKTQVELAKKGIVLQVAKIRTEIKTYDAEIASLEKELTLADEIYKNYEGRYREKLASMSDVIIKQSEQIQKILELQMAQNKRNERIFALEKLANGENK
nr:TolC family protein [uncultured Sulfurimonas sp.]